MESRYVCFTCYHYHPEMKGVSQEDFDAGDNVCNQEKCPHNGEKLEKAEYCEVCDKLFRPEEHHSHKKV